MISRDYVQQATEDDCLKLNIKIKIAHITATVDQQSHTNYCLIQGWVKNWESIKKTNLRASTRATNVKN